jgi:hypothetical protein
MVAMVDALEGGMEVTAEAFADPLAEDLRDLISG